MKIKRGREGYFEINLPTWLREAERRDTDKATRGWDGRKRPKEIK